MDLSGPKPPVELLTLRSNSTVADAVDLGFDFFSSSAALGPWISSERTTSGPQSGRTGVPALSEGMIRGSDQASRVHALSGSTPREIHQEKPESAPIRFQALGWYKIAWNPTVPFEGLTIASIVDSQR